MLQSIVGNIMTYHNFYKFINLFFIGILISLFYTNCGEAPQGETSSSSRSNDVGANYSGQLTSYFQYISTSGVAWGYAYDSRNPSSTLRILFYLDNPVGSGQFIGETQANLTSVGPNTGHYFSFQIPAAYANGTQHRLYAYAHSATPSNLLSPNYITYVAYTPKAESVFNQQIRGFVQTNCASCHTWNYAGLYGGPLLNPTPFAGGTATSNLFIRKMSGQTGHSGGVFCSGGVNSGICSEIQRWWSAEFN